MTERQVPAGRSPTWGPTHRWRHVSAAVAALTLVGCAATHDPAGPDESAPRDHPQVSEPSAPEPDGAAPDRAPAEVDHLDSAAPVSAPVRVALPDIDVDASVIELGLRDDGTIEVPPDGIDAGWFQDGAKAGEPGPTVIGAHVDWEGEPGAFTDLDALHAGSVITVEDADGRTVDYRVDRQERHRKVAFPTFEVYGATSEDTLRLVTCAGPFDQEARSYRDNLVVFATAID